MYFQRDPTTRLWENQHYFKGFSRSLAAANVNRPVPAVTGACLMIDRALYDEVGGLREDYVQGGYEDSDLCLRLIEAGPRQLVPGRRRSSTTSRRSRSRSRCGSPTGTTPGFRRICGTTRSSR